MVSSTVQSVDIHVPWDDKALSFACGWQQKTCKGQTGQQASETFVLFVTSLCE